MVGYLTNNQRNKLHEVLMFKGRFEVLKGIDETGYPDGIRIRTLRRDLMFRTGNVWECDKWYEAI